MTVQAVFFDMGGTIETIWYTPELRLQATPDLQSILRSGGIDLQLSHEELHELVIRGWNRYHAWAIQSTVELSPEMVWSEYIFNNTPVDRKKLASIAQELMFFLETRFYHREMRPEVPVVLEDIQKMGLKIGLISNVCSRDQVPVCLGQYGIRDYFNPIVLSSEYGRRKPDPAIFHFAARLANVPASQCAYIGDRIARDILGARRAGFRLAVQIRHDYAHGEVDAGATPDVVIDHMTEFLKILQAEQRKPTTINTEEKGTSLIRAMLFDAGDILYFRKEGVAKLAAFLLEIGLTYKELPAKKRDALRDQAYQGIIDLEEYMERVLRFQGVTHPEEIARGKKIIDEDANDVKIFEGVAETLNTLKAEGYLLGIITDTALPVSVKLNWFERAGFGNVWDSVISSRELGVRKPNPMIYQAALQQLGITADQAVFVGHKSSELDGAKAVGIHTIAFNYDDNCTADHYLSHFADLLKIPQLFTTVSGAEV